MTETADSLIQVLVPMRLLPGYLWWQLISPAPFSVGTVITLGAAILTLTALAVAKAIQPRKTGRDRKQP